MSQPAPATKVFLSHTSEMAEHPKEKSFVQAALDAVREARMIAADMQDFPAASMSPQELDTRLLLDCRIYIGILGFRYGMPVRDQRYVSYTQHEFRTAKEAGKTLLLFLLHEEAIGLPGTMFRDGEYGKQQEAFRQEVLNLDGNGLVCQFFKTADELQRLIVRALLFTSTDLSRGSNSGRSRIAQFEAALQTYCDRQIEIWNTCLEGGHDRQDRLDHYVEPHYSLMKPEAQTALAGDRFGREKPSPAQDDGDGHRAYDPVAADGDDAETELSKLLTVSSRLCLAEDAGAGKSVFTRRALAFACSQQGQLVLFDGHPGLVVRWEQWENDWPSDFRRALANAIADDCDSNGASVSPEDLVDWALRHGRMLVILDGLDQVSDPQVVRGVAAFLNGDGRKCRAIVTGRTNRIDANRYGLFRSDEWRFARIEGFNDEQIAAYLVGFNVDQLFPQRGDVQDLLRIPSVLRIIRELLEQDKRIESFRTRGELYLQASYQLILRAGKLIDPEFDDRKTRRIEQILAAVAFEMMTQELYSYASRGADSVDRIERAASLRCTNGITDREWTLVREVTHLTNHCILEGHSQTMLSWQHRGMMEFYAGLHMARYATGKCLSDARRVASVSDWHWAWRFAIEMPDTVAEAAVRTAALSHLFERPQSGRRPNELIYRSWKVLEATPEGCEVLNTFQNEYRDLLAANNPIARQIEDSFRLCPPNPDHDSRTFLIGSPATDKDARNNEKPQVEMTAKSFLMANAPVTKEQYWLYDPAHEHDTAFAEDLARSSPDRNCPVIFVTWYDAWCFAVWCGGRLPREREWEFACRAGTTSRYWWGDEMDEQKCTFRTRQTTPASPQHANRWELMEMPGNVFEWCDTWYSRQISESAHEEFEG
ncbi:MAG: SUMF1/EgtB/PvdO family nonheme iron enzyme, partial [Planctomycetaceae bacterium]